MCAFLLELSVQWCRGDSLLVKGRVGLCSIPAPRWKVPSASEKGKISTNATPGSPAVTARRKNAQGAYLPLQRFDIARTIFLKSLLGKSPETCLLRDSFAPGYRAGSQLLQSIFHLGIDLPRRKGTLRLQQSLKMEISKVMVYIHTPIGKAIECHFKKWFPTAARLPLI